MIIDIHTHYVPPSYFDYIRQHGASVDRELLTGSSSEIFIKGHVRTFPIERGFHDIEFTLSQMARRGVDCHVVSAPPFMFHYEQSITAGAEVARLFNEDVSTLCARYPAQFVAMATVPLQSPEHAVRELEFVNKLGFRAVEIGASIDQRELDDPALDVFWEAAEKLSVLVFIHPTRPPGRERMLPYHLFNLIGFLAETTLAAARLIYSGVLDRYPQLKICLAHAGGTLLWNAGRFDQGHATIEACRKNIQRRPSEYLTSFYYDSITYRPQTLAYAAELVGSGRIVMGSDYPFAIAEANPVGSIKAVTGLTEDEQMAICGGTAASLLGVGNLIETGQHR